MSFRTRAGSARFVLFILASTVTFATPAAAQSREQRQLMADVRMMQEQNQIIQNLLGSIAEALKATTARLEARIDEQANNTSRALADQKLVIDTLSNNVREIREKLDDTNVRLGTLNTEVDALRQGVQQLNARPAFTESATLEPGGAPAGGAAGAGSPAVPGAAGAPAASVVPGAPGVGDTGAAAAPPPPPVVPIGTSPQKLFDAAQADYRLGQYDLAIAGFEAFIQYFPRAERAGDAQVHIGLSYLQAGKNEQAVEAFDAAIRDSPGAPMLPEAYYKKGIALRNLKRLDEARAAFEHVVKTYPEAEAASLARQELARQGPAKPAK
jgi:tol-pal system protein YbgF